MPKPYGEEARELCRKLYCKYGGKNHDAIEAEMRRTYPGWKRSNLYDRGPDKTRKGKLGWINAYGFEASLELATRFLIESVQNDDQRDYLKLQEICKRLEAEALKADANKDALYIYRDFFRLKLEMKTKLEVSRDNFETFVDCWEKVLGWIGSIDPAAAKTLVKHGEKLTELAQAHYGKTEAVDGGTISGADESGDGPPAAPGQ